MNKDWLTCNLEDYINLIDYRGRTPKKTESGIRLITAKNVKLGFLQQKPEEFIASDNYEEWMRRGIPNYGDVIFTTEAPLGNVAQIDTHEKLAFAQRIIVMQPEVDKISQNFLKYMFLSPNLRKELFNKATGATVQGIKSSLLKKIEITFPKTIEEQNQIVEILDKAFESIEQVKINIEKNIQNTKELFQSRLNEIFSQKGDGWEEKELIEISKIMYGYTAKSKDIGNTKYLRITDIQDNSVDWINVPFCELENEEFKKYELKCGDIVFARTGATTGKSYLIKERAVKAVFASYLIRVQLNEEYLLPEFLNLFFQTSYYWNEINLGISGSAQGGFNAKKLGALKISYPINEKEQQDIIEEMTVFNHKTKQLEKKYQQKLKNLEELKKSILQKAFSGELIP